MQHHEHAWFGSLKQMAENVKERVAARLKALIGDKKIVDLGRVGGPSKSYLYRMIGGTANPSIEELEAVCRAYGVTLGEFFEPWATEKQAARQEHAAEMRTRLEALIGSDADLKAARDVLRMLAPDAPNRTNKRTR